MASKRPRTFFDPPAQGCKEENVETNDRNEEDWEHWAQDQPQVLAIQDDETNVENVVQTREEGYHSGASTASYPARAFRGPFVKCDDCRQKTYVNKWWWHVPHGWCLHCRNSIVEWATKR